MIMYKVVGSLGSVKLPHHFPDHQVLLQQYERVLKLAEVIVVTLRDVELPEWKLRQRMACIGSPVDTCLDHLQKW